MEAIAFNIPGVGFVRFSSLRGKVNAHENDNREWMAADVELVLQDGRVFSLASIEYETGWGIRCRSYDEHGNRIMNRHFQIPEQRTEKETNGGMKSYAVKVTYIHEVEVQEENEEDAIESACEMAWQLDADSVITEIVSVEEIENDD